MRVYYHDIVILPEDGLATIIESAIVSFRPWSSLVRKYIGCNMGFEGHRLKICVCEEGGEMPQRCSFFCPFPAPELTLGISSFMVSLIFDDIIEFLRQYIKNSTYYASLIVLTYYLQSPFARSGILEPMPISALDNELHGLDPCDRELSQQCGSSFYGRTKLIGALKRSGSDSDKFGNNVANKYCITISDDSAFE